MGESIKYLTEPPHRIDYTDDTGWVGYCTHCHRLFDAILENRDGWTLVWEVRP